MASRRALIGLWIVLRVRLFHHSVGKCKIHRCECNKPNQSLIRCDRHLTKLSLKAILKLQFMYFSYTLYLYSFALLQTADYSKHLL